MGFQKGKSGNPSGRPKGSKNRSTAAVRDSLAILVENNIENMQEWLERMAEDDPKIMRPILDFQRALQRPIINFQHHVQMDMREDIK